mmetsp:Transcript_89547/g.208572  ORF Transcript_89547/g.208572 Transcript_89547/m.208572 type:complete len:222 (-) Transcript_89547:351-1016(-)
MPSASSQRHLKPPALRRQQEPRALPCVLVSRRPAPNPPRVSYRATRPKTAVRRTLQCALALLKCLQPMQQQGPIRNRVGAQTRRPKRRCSSETVQRSSEPWLNSALSRRRKCRRIFRLLFSSRASFDLETCTFKRRQHCRCSWWRGRCKPSGDIPLWWRGKCRPSGDFRLWWRGECRQRNGVPPATRRGECRQRLESTTRRHRRAGDRTTVESQKTRMSLR